jgi:hypothetical protein
MAYSPTISDRILHTSLDEGVSVVSRNVFVYRAPFASDHHKGFAIGHEAFEFFTTKLVRPPLEPDRSPLPSPRFSALS